MNNDLVQKIISERIPCFFISPHLDDAILSAGDLISYLAGKTTVHVVTIFTEVSPKPYTLSAKSFVRQSGYGDPENFFSDRRREDMEILNAVGAKAVHLGFVDGTWRKFNNASLVRRYLGRFIPEFIHLYPVHQLHIVSGVVHPEDESMCKKIAGEIQKLTKEAPSPYIFCPAGFGSHVDHVITRTVCEKTYPKAFLWSDFPYNLNKRKTFPVNGYGTFYWENNLENKKKLIQGYKTQVNTMFRDGNIPSISETYYIPENYKNI